jgi:hypothetical protein
LGSWHVYDYAVGFLAGWGAHPLDIAQWGLDMDHTSPVRYEGHGRVMREGLWDTVYDWDLECTYASGLKMHFMSTEAAKPIVPEYRKWADHGTTFFGSEGWLSVDRGGLHASTPELRAKALNLPEGRLRKTKGHPNDFIACIKSRETPISSLESGIRSDTISHLSDVAIRLGKPVTWDPDAELVVGDDLAQAMLSRPMRDPWHLEDL